MRLRNNLIRILLLSIFLSQIPTLARAAVAPTITSQPTSIVVANGATSFNISVTATRSDGGTLTYQWFKRLHLNDNSPTTLSNGTRISGATSSSLTIGASGSTVTASDAGIFYVTVTNTLNGETASTTSSNASVVVTLLEEGFRNASLTNSNDWIFTYNNSNYANSQRTLQGGSLSTANEYFQPCLTASSGTATTVTSGNTEATVGAGNNKTVQTLGSCNGTNISTAGNGALRMSSNRLDTKASAVFTREINTSSGLDISFGFASYGGLEGNNTGGTADGSGFYLMAGGATDYSPGGAGGAIGYARRGTEQGVQSGLFAVGLDAYGNVGTSGHVGTNCAAGSITDFNNSTYTAVASITRDNDKIAVLGPAGTTRTTGYCLLATPTGTATTTLSGYSGGDRAITFSNPSVTSRTSGTNGTCTVCRDIRIIVDSSAIPSNDRKIYVIVDGTVRYEINQPQALKDSSTFKFGFSSATGGSSIISEFWGINVNTFTGVTAPDRPTSVTTSTANGVDSSKTISWTAPGAWGIGELASGATGAVNRSYVARIIDSSGNDTSWTCSTTSTSCTIEGITSGTYTARVTAINRSGISSLPSDGSSSFTSTLTIQSSCANFAQLQNGSFETPAISGTNLIRNDASINSDPDQVAWRTTATDNQLEIWRNPTPVNGVSATEGVQLAELNANQFAGLYQDVSTVGGSIIRWRLSHRGRNGTESMKLLIGTTTGSTTYTRSDSTTISIPGTFSPSTGVSGTASSGLRNGTTQNSIEDNNSTWGTWSGSYTVPSNQTTTRFLFISFNPSSGGGGNLLDDVIFTPLAACPDTVSGISSTSKTVNILSNDFGFSLGTLSIISATQTSGTTLSSLSFSGNNLTYTPPSNFNSGSIVVTYTFRNSSNSSEISASTVTIVPEVTQRSIVRFAADPTKTSKTIRSIQLNNTFTTSIYTCIDLVTSNNSTTVETASGSPTISVASGGTQTQLNSNRSVRISGTLANSQSALNRLTLNANGASSIFSGSGASRWVLVRSGVIDTPNANSPTCSTTNQSWIEISPLELRKRRIVTVLLN